MEINSYQILLLEQSDTLLQFVDTLNICMKKFDVTGKHFVLTNWTFFNLAIFYSLLLNRGLFVLR